MNDAEKRMALTNEAQAWREAMAACAPGSPERLEFQNKMRNSSQKTRSVAAIHYRNRSDLLQSRHKPGAGNRRVGNGKLQIEGARRGAVARQEARADPASRSCQE